MSAAAASTSPHQLPLLADSQLKAYDFAKDPTKSQLFLTVERVVDFNSNLPCIAFFGIINI
jgi:hypothetical protein